MWNSTYGAGKYSSGEAFYIISMQEVGGEEKSEMWKCIE